MQESRRGVLYGLSAYVVWGFLTVYWHELKGLDALELIGVRIVLSLALLFVLLALKRSWGWLRRLAGDRRLLARTTAASLLLSANWLTYVYCVTHGNVVETALGYFIAPLGTVLVGVLFLHERLRRAQGFALGLATVAVLVLAAGYGKVPWFALVLAASWSFYGLLKKLMPLTALEGLSAETLVLAPAALAVIVLVERSGNGIAQQATTTQLVLLSFAGVVTTVPLLLFAAASKRVPLTTLGPLQYAVPTINFILGVVVYHEPMPTWRLAGFALVWVALVLMTADSVRSARRYRVPASRTLTPAVVDA